MSKVRCKFCVYESKELCQKNKKSGKFVKVKINKPRTCFKYEEDSAAVFANFRKKEKKLKRLRELRLK